MHFKEEKSATGYVGLSNPGCGNKLYSLIIYTIISLLYEFCFAAVIYDFKFPIRHY